MTVLTGMLALSPLVPVPASRTCLHPPTWFSIEIHGGAAPVQRATLGPGRRLHGASALSTPLAAGGRAGEKKQRMAGKGRAERRDRRRASSFATTDRPWPWGLIGTGIDDHTHHGTHGGERRGRASASGLEQTGKTACNACCRSAVFGCRRRREIWATRVRGCEDARA